MNQRRRSPVDIFADFRRGDYKGLVNDDEFLHKPAGWGARHTLVLLGFWGYVISYAMRINLSFAIVAMVKTPPVDLNSTSSYGHGQGHGSCPELLSDSDNLTNLGEASPEGEFGWTSEEQGIILGAFSLGYAVTQLPGGIITDKYGGKWPFGIGILVTAMFALLTPAGARAGKGEIFKIRVIQGLAEGVISPAMHGLLAKWLPPMETSKLGAFVYAGTRIGIVLTLPMCGLLIGSGFGWPSVFYVSGFLGIGWFILWVIFAFDEPGTHPTITDRERMFIQYSIGGQMSKHQIPTPWVPMLTSMPVLAILIAQTGQGWGLQTLLTELPTYMKSVLHFNITDNGWWSALPYLVMWIVSLTASWLADFVRENGIASTTVVRKVCNTIAHWIPALALIGIAYTGCDRYLTMTLLTVALGFNGFAAAGYQMNHIDIAANHSAVMSGYTNTVANLVGMAAPMIAGWLTNGGDEGWKFVFLIAAAIYILDNLFYIYWGSGEEQWWNRDPNEDAFDYMAEMSESYPLLRGGYDDYDYYDNTQFVYG